MRTNFKSNSRFASLAEETTNKKDCNNKKKEEIKKICETSNNVNNSFKSEKTSFKSENRNQRNYYTNRISNEKLANEQIIKKEEQEKLKQKNFERDMAPENFPNLVTNINIPLSLENTISFANALTENILKKNVSKKEEIPSGWCIFQLDKKTNKIKINYESQTYVESKKINKKSDITVLNSLVELHEKRTKKYIELYGYDTWEKIFLFQNYDYGWADRLDEEDEEDEQYEEEMELLEQYYEEYHYIEDNY